MEGGSGRAKRRQPATLIWCTFCESRKTPLKAGEINAAIKFEQVCFMESSKQQHMSVTEFGHLLGKYAIKRFFEASEPTRLVIDAFL